MMPRTREGWLRLVLAAAGAFFIVGLYPMSRLWPAGFGWQPPHPAFERMITAIYASLGLFMLLAARRPRRYLPIIDFAIVSSAVHGLAMLPDAWHDPENRLHLATDIPALLLLALVLLLLRPAVAGPAEPAAAPPGSGGQGRAPGRSG